MTDEQLRDLRVCPPSGDWRDSEGHLELQAALAVVVPGFPVKRSQVALAASSDGSVRTVALILAGGSIPVHVTEVAVDATVLAAVIEGPEALDSLIQA